MADPYFNSHSLYLEFHKAYESVMSSNGLVFNGWPEQRGLAFGLQVEQTAPGKYLNALISCGASFNNPFSDFHFKKVPPKVISSQDSEQSEPLDLSDKPEAYQPADQNTSILTGQSELRIDRVWSMAGEVSSHLNSINANHLPLTSTLKDTAGKSFSGSGKSTPKSLSVADIHHNPRQISNPLPNNQSHVDPLLSAPTVTVSIVNPQLKLNSELLQRNTPSAGNQLDFKASASGSGESLTISHDKAYQKAYARSEKRKASKRAWAQSEKGKAYAQSEKRKACQKAYRKSEKGKAYERSEKRKAYQKAYQKAYRKSDRGQACRKAYERSEKRQAYLKAYRGSEKGKANQRAYYKAFLESEKGKANKKAYQKVYQKAFYKAFKNTGDKEQAKIAARQATAFIKESNKAKNNKLESTSISPLLPAFQIG